MMNGSGSLCRMAIGSTTHAQKAQHVLAKSAIRAEVVKISSGESNRGCVYGIEFACILENNVEEILRLAGFSPANRFRGTNR